MHRRMDGKHHGKIAASAVLSAIMMIGSLSAAGCNRQEGDFPDIGAPETSVSESEPSSDPDGNGGTTTDPTGNIADDYISVTVAVPYSQSTVRRLSALYYIKSNGSMSDGDNGSNISLDHLDSIVTPWYVGSIQTSRSGVDPSTLSEWRDTGSVPDIYLAEDIDSVIDSSDAIALQQYLADSSLIGTASLFDGAIDDLSRDGSIYGIPFYATAMIMAINLDYVPDEGVPSYVYTTEDLTSYLRAVSDLNREPADEDDRGVEVIPFAGAYQMMPYISYAVTGNSLSYMMHDEYTGGSSTTALSALRHIVGYCDGLYDEGLSSNADSSGEDPIASRKAGMWLLSSEEMEDYNSYYPGRLYYLPLPSYDEETHSVPMMTVYPLCLSPECENVAFAADFALFIALDPDAQLLIRRLEPRDGYYPLIRNASIWLELADGTDNGRLASYFESVMDDAVYCPGNYGNGLYGAVNSYISAYSERRSDNSEAAGFVLQDCYGGY